jgi:hypothetical protein
MSGSALSQGGNLDDFQALFMSLPKSTQRQLLGQVVQKEGTISNENAPSPKESSRNYFPVKIEPTLPEKNHTKTVLNVSSLTLKQIY